MPVMYRVQKVYYCTLKSEETALCNIDYPSDCKQCTIYQNWRKAKKLANKKGK